MMILFREKQISNYKMGNSVEMEKQEGISEWYNLVNTKLFIFFILFRIHDKFQNEKKTATFISLFLLFVSSTNNLQSI